MIFNIFNVNGVDKNINLSNIVLAFESGSGSLILLDSSESITVTETLTAVEALSSQFVVLTEFDGEYSAQVQNRKVLFNKDFIKDVQDYKTGATFQYGVRRYNVIENKSVITSVTGSASSGLTATQLAQFNKLVAQGELDPVNEKFSSATGSLSPTSFDTDHVQNPKSLIVSWNGSVVPYVSDGSASEYHWVIDTVGKVINIIDTVAGGTVTGLDANDTLFVIQGFVNKPL